MPAWEKFGGNSIHFHLENFSFVCVVKFLREKVQNLSEMMGAGGLAIEENATNDQIETAVVPAPSRRTRTSTVKPDVALEWSNIQIKFRVVSQDFYSNNDLYDLFPDVDPQAPSYR